MSDEKDTSYRIALPMSDEDTIKTYRIMLTPAEAVALGALCLRLTTNELQRVATDSTELQNMRSATMQVLGAIQLSYRR
jgi:hypothetical protein